MVSKGPLSRFIRRDASTACRRLTQSRRRRLAAAFETLESRRLLAFSADVFADINLLGVSANVNSMVQFDGRAFFAANDGQTGSELWVSDGTTGGTRLFADLLPGRDGSQPSELTVLGSHLFFTARDESGEFDLWKTDGTESGTVMVFDANEAGVYLPEQLTASGGKLFFTAYQIDLGLPGSGDTGTELWVHDPVTNGTTLVLDINPDQSIFFGPTELTDHNGTLFFSSYESGYDNRELWKSDGTASGTMLVADIAGFGGDNSFSSDPSNLTSLGSLLFFSAYDVETGTELYVYNGTSVTLLEINAGPDWSSPKYLTAYNGEVYFSANDGSGSERLFRSNGTTVTLVNPTLTNPAELTVVGSNLFFVATDAIVGREIWRTNGVSTTLVRDIVTGAGSSNPSQLTVAGGILYFSADEPTTVGRELWRTQEFSSLANTFRVVDSRTGVDASGVPLSGDPRDLVAINNRLFFTTLDNFADRELWTSQGTVGTTGPVKNINPATQGAAIGEVLVVGTKIYFTANNGINGQALWIADTTVPGSVTMIDTTPGTSSQSISGLTVHNGQVYFYNNLGGPNSNGAIYLTDGTPNWLMVAEVSPIPFSTSASDLFYSFGNNLYFAAMDNTGVELWRTDASGTSAARFVDLYTGNTDGSPNSGSPKHFATFNGKLYFAATNAANGRELWESNGTAAGTVVARDINPGAGNSNPEFLTVSGNQLYFSANNGSTGQELWSLSTGNVLTQYEVNVGAAGSFPINLTDLGGTLYFSASDDNQRLNKEIYRVAGGAAVLVEDINPAGNQGSNPSDFVAFGGQVYFAATAENSGRELWRTTATGAELVHDVPGSANPTQLAATSNRLFYSAVDENSLDRELWTTGGPVMTGAVQALDLFPGIFRGSHPTDIVEIGGTVYFVAENDLYGRELFVLTEFTPSVESVVINDGVSAQRSQITSLTVTFDAIVDADEAAFVITNIDTNTQVTNIQVDISEQDFKTVAVLTFGTGGTSVVNRLGTGPLGNSLADGNYRLDVVAAQINEPTGGGALADFQFGGQTRNDVPNDNFFRIFGDANGDGNTDFIDFATLGGFLGAFGSAEGDSTFNPGLDANGDGLVDFADFAAGTENFLGNFGKLRN